ncbi:MAG: hypothetical protein ACR652_18975 [Methylocystis sp.]|jgi:ElaB/YqjD/DUF883 family membrane-anchored ribosome-binding protein|uniref:hypothetical protein n=1 Tax=Methylocystis sp. TaxID=1911079 RepID=UPI002FBB2B0D
MAEERTVQQRQHNGHGEMTTGALAEQAAIAGEQMGRSVQRRANEAISRMTERGNLAAQRTGEVLGNFQSAIETSARSQPTTTVMLAAFAGFFLGALWRMGR